jgi:NADH:ubiquinone oxidoreductase subunit 6 (subunit J)
VTQPIPLILAVLLVASSVAALLVRRLLWSLILLFYSSLLLGGILFWYGAVYAGLFHIITFAGAVSVVFMVIIMLVGQDASEKRALRPELVVGLALAVAGAVPFLMLSAQLTPVSDRIQETTVIPGSTDELGFLWNFQGWSLLFVLLPVTGAILAVVNLFSREGEVE